MIHDKKTYWLPQYLYDYKGGKHPGRKHLWGKDSRPAPPPMAMQKPCGEPIWPSPHSQQPQIDWDNEIQIQIHLYPDSCQKGQLEALAAGPLSCRPLFESQDAGATVCLIVSHSDGGARRTREILCRPPLESAYWTVFGLVYTVCDLYSAFYEMEAKGGGLHETNFPENIVGEWNNSPLVMTGGTLHLEDLFFEVAILLLEDVTETLHFVVTLD